MKRTATVEVKPVSEGKTNSEPEVCAEQPLPTRIEALLMAGSRPVTEARTSVPERRKGVDAG